jgi:hypothetical protein
MPPPPISENPDMHQFATGEAIFGEAPNRVLMTVANCHRCGRTWPTGMFWVGPCRPAAPALGVVA